MFEKVVKVYKIPLAAQGDIQAFLEKLSKRIRTPIASITVRRGTLRVELSGPATQIAESLEAIKELLQEYDAGLGRRAKTKVFTYGVVEELIGTGVPVDTLEELLKLRGYPTRRRAKKSIETTAPKRVVVEEARKLAKALERLRGVKLSRTAVKIAAVASAYLGLDPLQVVEEAVKAGVLHREQDGRISVDYAWRGALREFIRLYRAKS